MSHASLPMYAFAELAAANRALWGRLRAGVAGAPAVLDETGADPGEIGADVVFTQVCGYPLLRRFAGQAVVLGVPRYGFEGCAGATHRAAFIVRESEPTQALAEMRGRVFGCNSIHSNTGMNLPRLSLARVAEGRPFFRQVVWTGAHLASLAALAAGEIDLCAVDCVTWGLARRELPERCAGLRVLGWTEPSPCLPFVSSVATEGAMVAALARALAAASEPGLGLLGVEAEAGFAVLAEYEREAVELGYAVLR